MAELKDYTNPITKKEHIKELQEVLIQATIDYINKYNLRDIDEVNISVNYTHLKEGACHRIKDS